jgi:uncharacterized protein involved in exopolysaccharide biosynthesis
MKILRRYIADLNAERRLVVKRVETIDAKLKQAKTELEELKDKGEVK